MKLPNAERAIVPKEKITRYLLNLDHEAGHGKAKFFIRCGYQPEQWEILQEALFRHAAAHEVMDEELTQYGKKYIIEGHLQAPNARSYLVRTVWMIDEDKDFPELKTAYPCEERRRR
ncbi:MAG: hypothetical protein OXF22_09110 [Anaerolineaceae bacterium]|nr:hypothetical protein [Anaerolineaceae bacterium]